MHTAKKVHIRHRWKEMWNRKKRAMTFFIGCSLWREANLTK